MSRIRWEYDLVERPFCEQLQAMGWQWIEGDPDVPELTERANFREVLLTGRLGAALRKLNLRDGQPWLDDDRIRLIIEKLEKAEGHRLMEINESATKLLLKGTEIDGLPDWNFGRNQPVRFTDFENPANNDLLVINQNPAYARKMSVSVEEILQRFKDDWNTLERELRKFIDDLRQGDRNDVPDLDPTVDRAGELVVHVPLETPADELARWVGKKLLWVHRKLALKEEAAPRMRAPEYVSGAAFSYLGRRYRLKLVEHQEHPLQFDGAQFTLRRDAQPAEPHFRNWYVTTGADWLKRKDALFNRAKDYLVFGLTA